MTVEKKVGIFFLVAVLIMVILLESVQNKPLFRKEYSLRTYFHSVRGLERGDSVRLAGLKVGEIKNITIAGDKVEVLMAINKGVPVRADSRAAIKMVGLLGGRYLGLSLGSPSSPLLEPDSVVSSLTSPDMDELLVKVNTIVSEVQKFTGVLDDNKDNIRTILSSLSASSPQLKESLERLGKITEKIEKGEGTLGKLINDDTLYLETKKTVQEIGRAAEGVQEQTPLAAFTSVLFGISK
ncbi:MAG: MCE family protein [Nitrospirae bacterium]|nr:MCE family protein [Nitrospirota bacterium]